LSLSNFYNNRIFLRFLSRPSQWPKITE